MINTKVIEMRNLIKEEVAHIPRGNLHQNLLRQFYATIRLNSLGSKAKYPNNKNECLRISIENMKDYAKKEGKTFEPQYVKNFFKL